MSLIKRHVNYVIAALIAGLLIGWLIIPNLKTQSVGAIDYPPYSFSSTSFSMSAQGVWEMEGNEVNVSSIDCYYDDMECIELVTTIVYAFGKYFVYRPFSIEYEIQTLDQSRIIARRDGGAAVLTLDISLSSETVQKERLEEGKVTRTPLVSGAISY